ALPRVLGQLPIFTRNWYERAGGFDSVVPSGRDLFLTAPGIEMPVYYQMFLWNMAMSGDV
ncbi:MAG: hypothetical protein AAB380_05470, partial [Verrucomicrobiota bacterium]